MRASYQYLLLLVAVLFCSSSFAQTATLQAATLPSWNKSDARQAIIQFVEKVTDKGGADYVPPDERIAVFDNDGTLWSEQPVYFQLQFAIDRVHQLAPKHPEWKTQQPFKAVLDNDMDAVMASGEKGLLEIVMATHAGMTTEEFEQVVSVWLAEAKHPRFNKLYTEMVFQPMLELLGFLRANDFKTYIVSGGGIEFIRPWAQTVYGIPPEQVIGSSSKVIYKLREGAPVLERLPVVDFINDKAGKPVAIHKFIGRRPIAAFGNSDGDLQMLQWTDAGDGQRLMMIVHHTDKKREWAYDRKSHIGRLDEALMQAGKKGWSVIDMKQDWKRIYSFE
ncbi:MAG: haloacid dehalogenase-like hydrolase [Proteobacteria bacterium]|nr:haloacid dehalogenase-like hydrolase [Pseudomonadota bacterium]